MKSLGTEAQSRSKKKIDYQALQSPLMRIPKMDLRVTRALIDLGIKEIYDLQGRSPEILFEEATQKNPEINEYCIRYFRLAVYVAENNPDLDPQKVHPDCWA
ncbi:MAG: hypothetical protein DBX03_01465 [Puniceicoccaceae bacterium]|nr:MAG: hypothetical protein DBX03_01465 [Puniceicoccaceae bacterium]